MIFGFFYRWGLRKWLKKQREELCEKRDIYLRRGVRAFVYRDSIRETSRKANIRFIKDRADDRIDWDSSREFVRMGDFLQELLREIESIEAERGGR